MKFPMRISIKEWLPVYSFGAESWRWKSLCIVYDNEALGFMERLLMASGFEFESVSTDPEVKG